MLRLQMADQKRIESMVMKFLVLFCILSD